MKKLPKAVIALGLVSFFTDFSSEMIYPLLPLFLTEVLGAGALALGLIEGVAESVAAFLKLGAGFWTDRTGKRKPFLLAGYGLAGLVRPLIGLAWAWPVVLILRFMDRIGKGLRSSPRDALIADITEPGMRGRAFGVNRSLDHAGSVAGPLVAAGLITWGGFSLGHVFLAAAVPAVVVMLILVFAVPESRSRPNNTRAAFHFRDNWHKLPSGFRWFLACLALFTLGNATDAFLLLALHGAGIQAQAIAVLWAGHHLIKMVAAYVSGRLSDRLGRKALIGFGWLSHALVYLVFAFEPRSSMMVVVFLIYGLCRGLTGPVERALVADFAEQGQRGSAFGFYHLVVGIAALPASLLFGLVWYGFGAPWAFALDAVLAILALVCLGGVGKAGFTH